MAKVITFSRVFPMYHPRKGEPTFFVEKFLWQQGYDPYFWKEKYLPCLFELNKKNISLGKLSSKDIEDFYLSLNPLINKQKGHTIRKNFRFKKGEFFSPRFWSGISYNSPQIIFLPDIKIVKTWKFELTKSDYFISNSRPKIKEIIKEKKALNSDQISEIAYNDGLTADDFKLWFQEPFLGQIICWNENIDYSL